MRDFKIKKREFVFDFEGDKAYFYFIFKTPSLGDYFERQGPPIKLEKDVKKFKANNKKTYARRGRIYAKVKREFTKAENALRILIKERLKSDISLRLIK